MTKRKKQQEKQVENLTEALKLFINHLNYSKAPAVTRVQLKSFHVLSGVKDFLTHVHVLLVINWVLSFPSTAFSLRNNLTL